MGRHATRPTTRRRWLPAATTGAALLVATAVLVPVLGQDDRSDAAGPGAVPVPGSPGLTLAIGGDVAFAGRTLPLLTDPAGPFPEAGATLTDADLALADLSTPVGAAGAAALAAAGVDLVAVVATPDAATAADTLDALSAAGLRPVGAGRDGTAAGSPQRVEVDGQGVTVLGLSLAPGATAAGIGAGLATPTLADAVLAAVGVADRRGDVVLVRLSGSPACAADTRELTDRLVSAGADVVLGAGDVPAGAWWASGDRRAWAAPSPGPLLSADESTAPPTGLLRLVVREGAVVGAAFDPASTDPFGRLGGVRQTTISPNGPQTPTEARCDPANGPRTAP
ncbi:CapA family protein [Modestobacter sp. Leaf380]|uniref:CapA family protein n=1 Tax=Modestobacter sp. Leaf380 TaxID=1736356 RepID=UPI0006FDB069|nr:CapA family protein [Modestobacter sp. Leaf380]KQS64912.1 hypothetical protein ASG41_15860 [Modestobacter sp. Leaf380]